MVSIDIWGTIGYSSYTEEIGNFFHRFVHFSLDININTGEAMGISISNE